MARELQEAPRSQRLIHLGAVLLASGGASVAFGRVFIGHGATLKLVLVAFLSVALAAAFERRSPLLAAVVSAVGLLWAIGLLVFPHTLWHGLPLGKTVHAIGISLGRVGRQADVQVAPTPPLRPLLMASVTAVWTAAFSTHALAVRSGSPLLAAIPPAALVGFTGLVLEDGARPAYAALFLVGVLTLLFADGLRRVRQWGPVRPWSSGLADVRRRLVPRTVTRGARRVVLAAMGVALLLPGLLPGFGAKPVLHIGPAAVGSGEIDPLIAVSNSLRRDEPVALFTVRTSADTGVYWRWLALDQFDGDRWTSRDIGVEHGRSFSSGEDLPVQAQHIPKGTETQMVVQTVTIVRSPGKWLPMAYEPLSIDLGGGFRFDRQHTAAVPDSDIEPGFTYRVTSRLVEPTYEQLNLRFDYSGSRYAALTRLPDDLPAVIPQIARGIVRQAHARTPLTEAIAIQDYLTSPQVGFQYDAEIPRGDGNSALVDFLTRTHKGFCQQFASAMAVLLRSLGIPARVAVGFTQGNYDAGLRAYDVTTENAHTWPEVLFPGFGWLPFEPTPSRTNPVTEEITDPTRGRPGVTPQGPGNTNTEGTGSSGGAPGGHKDPHFSSDPFEPAGGNPKPVHFIDSGQTPPGPRGTPLSVRTVLFLVLAGLALACALLLPVVKVLVRRIRTARARTARDRALAAYRLFESRAGDLGLGRWPGETPEEYRARLGRQLSSSDGHLESLTRIVGVAAYARQGVTDADATTAGRAGRTAIRDVRRGVPVARRVAALWRPKI